MAPEQVFVVTRRDFFDGAWPQGFVAWSPRTAENALAEFERAGFFVPRAEAEDNPEWKQLIPYCVLRRAGQLFCVERQRAQGEARLHGKLSIGLGGHVNPVDGPGSDTAGLIRSALRRELDEELQIDWASTVAPPALLGMLNDDREPVGRVHAGLVFRVDFASTGPAPGTCGEVAVRETSAMRGGFEHLVQGSGLWQDPARFESWSRILLEVGIAGPMAVSSRSHGAPKRHESGREEPPHG